ncbi:transporter substrate-binding domain-containing protein [Candidatus Reidiella endopervernicosa]|uniref:Transporter substrate-binding domain-containing protein n=1 Tax=Candidatus Reidiella endopervernicosa TaxID=2738883 RepID=A0A6N0HYM4_9GAMM|nr:transporter substrate-binding domain-containing protein [Candidatus Reidiella endopervernicosa]QKQ27361.1 transporter substrate-binding domain-containing protein [Candidatus Reidiella endopervernicosa]
MSALTDKADTRDDQRPDAGDCKPTSNPLRLIPTASWSETLASHRSGSCTLLAAAGDTAQRRELMNFTQPHGEYPLVVAVRNEELFVENLAAIQDKTLGVVRATPISI